MMRYRLMGIIVCALLTCSSLAQTLPKADESGHLETGQIDMSKLVPVTSKNQSRCVQFFMVNGKGYCSFTPLAHMASGVGLDKAKLIFDGRPWQVADGKKTPQGMVMVEYIVKGDNIDSWKELITSQYFPGMQERVTPAQVMDFTTKELAHEGLQPYVQTLSKKENEIVFEFRVTTPPEVQNEIQRVVSTQDGMYVLHYVIKKPDMGNAARKKWVGLLEAATFQP